MNKIHFPKNNTVYVCSSLYNHLHKIINLIKDSDDVFILNGNVCDQENDESILSDIEEIQNLKQTGRVSYVLGDRDLVYIKKQFSKLNFNPKLEWLLSQDKSCIVEFSNQTSITVVCGGIEGRLDNLENCFVNSDDWHENYNGKYGLVISNYPQGKNTRKIYEYSCSIGVNKEYLAIQKVNSQGLKEFVLI